ncbi:MAG: ATP-binding protein/SpoIIE family protein phosphatase [Cyclobacteriaceae bacterium]
MAQPLPSSAGENNSGAHSSYRFDDRSFLSLIKREVAQKARALGFSAERVGTLDIIISELSSNLLKFGERKREFLWKSIQQQGKAGIEIIAIDKGPGITHVYQALQDGYSTSGTSGEGLGAVKRLSDFFDIYSQPNNGTIVLCRCFVKSTKKKPGKPFTIGAVCIAKPGEHECGDGYQTIYNPAKKLFGILVVDGLGHGHEAHLASQLALLQYTKDIGRKPADSLAQIHEAIQNTRGAVGLIVSLDLEHQKLIYSGVGNISGKLTAWDRPSSLVSENGTLGYKTSRIREHEAHWKRGQMLIIHSDGIPSRWDLTAYPQIEKHDPTLLAACLYRDYARNHDDATVIVSKYPIFNEK